jgi:hypothetical protein
MVYYLSSSIGSPIFNDARAKPMTEMSYANPSEVHPFALHSNTVQMKQGYRVDPATAPKAMLYEDGGRLPDIISNQQVLVVCDRFRNLVERFEPGLHQFIPVDIFAPGHDGPIGRYHWFVVCQRLDSVDRDETTFKWKLDYTGESGFWSNRDIEDAKLVFSSSKTAGHHIWKDPYVLSLNCGFCSAAFGDAALNEGFAGLNVTPRATV